MIKNAVLSLSGGMDSTSLLLHLLSGGFNTQCVSFDYGQKHIFELEKAQELISFLKTKGFDVKHQIIKLDGLSELLVSGLVDNDSMDLKKGHYAHENALTTVVPNRNAIFASIIYAIALSFFKKTNHSCVIALGTHMGDFDNKTKQGIYPDCSEEFKVALEHAFKIGNWDSDKVDYYTPYNNTDKTGVLKDGILSCEELNLNYSEIFKMTNTSYSPVLVEGKWYSDFKTGSSIERIEAFMNLNKIDPIHYVDDNGEFKSWKFVVNYVKQILTDFNKL